MVDIYAKYFNNANDNYYEDLKISCFVRNLIFQRFCTMAGLEAQDILLYMIQP